MLLRTSAATTRGGVKKVNQDSYCVLEASTDFGPVALVVVCDGVGGLAAGELASTYVVNRFATWFETALPVYLAYNTEGGAVDLGKLEGVWADLLVAANKRIAAYAREHFSHDRKVRMGTTFSGLLVCQGRCFVGQVGDSRVYRLRGGALEALTKDQTWVQRELDTGTLTLEEAEHHPRRNVLLQAVGSQESLTPAFSQHELREGDAFAVCCDGFYRSSSEGEIRDLLAECRRAGTDELPALLQAALRKRIERGERDNITVACCLEGASIVDDELTNVLIEGSEGDETPTDVMDADRGGTEATASCPAGPDADDAPTGVLASDSPVSDAASDDAPTGVLQDDACAGPEPDDALTDVLVVGGDAPDDDATTTLGGDA